jgi:hypothetical protein
MTIDATTFIAWAVLAVLFVGVGAAIVYLGSLPGSIARSRNHPQADAINAASWIGLALLGAGWPIAFVWAFVRQGDFGASPADVTPADDGRIVRLQEEVDRLTASLKSIESRVAAINEQGE